jgi:hypothetical protein
MTNDIVEKPYTDPITGKFKEGNPGGGRPKGSGISITTEIKRKLEEIPEGKDKTYLHYLIEKIIKKAIIDEDQQTIKQIWNYIDGMPPQDFNLGGQENNPIFISETIARKRKLYDSASDPKSSS